MLRDSQGNGYVEVCLDQHESVARSLAAPIAPSMPTKGGKSVTC